MADSEPCGPCRFEIHRIIIFNSLSRFRTRFSDYIPPSRLSAYFRIYRDLRLSLPQPYFQQAGCSPSGCRLHSPSQHINLPCYPCLDLHYCRVLIIQEVKPQKAGVAGSSPLLQCPEHAIRLTFSHVCLKSLTNLVRSSAGCSPLW